MPIKLKKWDTAYIDSLPDEAFAVIEPAYLRGETEDKRCRHLPHHTEEVKDGSDSEDHIDLDHLRNAWQRRNQIVPFTDSISQEELRVRAERHLKKHIRDLDLGWGEEQQDLDLIPGQYSLSKNGTGQIKLISSLARLQKPVNSEHPTGSLPAVDDEFFRCRFRALSQIIIEDYAIDFTQPGVLEKSVPLLKNQTVYTDHNVTVRNWIGVVENALWDGNSTPPGVDADLKLDKTKEPHIIRGIALEPPAIHSCSVTVYFTWHKSHPELSDDFYDPDSFWAKLGTRINGELV
ncbi:MAG: hypothetical protein N2748_00325, partial [candidate division WOR-3 bacterium]|nr:hypothetical protein [candidate division WOR-3 bacterium]